MPTFRYEAMSSSGDEEVGVVEASDRQSAMQSLKERRLFVTRLVESSDGPAQSDATAANRDGSGPTSTSAMQNSPGKQMPKLVPAFFGVSGFACILGAALLASLTISRISGTVQVEGTVVEIARESSTDGETLAPLIEYYIKGQTFRIRGNVVSKHLFVGSRLPLLVRMDRVGAGIVDSFEVKWLPTLIVGAVGIAFLLVARLASGSRQRWSRESTAIDAGNDAR